jgi:hypothetical protein
VLAEDLMTDEELDRRLRELGREEPPRGFTARALARIETHRTRAPAQRWLAMAALATLAIAAWSARTARIAHAPPVQPRVQEAARLEAELAALRAEREQVAHELARLQESARPVVYVDGDDRVELVVRLAKDEEERR